MLYAQPILTGRTTRPTFPPHFGFIGSLHDRLCGLVVRVLGYNPEARVRFPALPEKKSSGSGTGSTQPREYNWGATW
jgi:hypothetical protein